MEHFLSTDQIAEALSRVATRSDFDRAVMNAAADLFLAHREFALHDTILTWELREQMKDGLLRFLADGRTFSDYSVPGRDLDLCHLVERGMAGNADVTQAVFTSFDVGSGRSYVYLYTRDPADPSLIRSFAIEHRGTQAELSRFLEALFGVKDPDPDKPIFLTREQAISLADIPAAAKRSYESPERTRAEADYLSRIERDCFKLEHTLEVQHREILKVYERLKVMLDAGIKPVEAFAAIYDELESGTLGKTPIRQPTSEITSRTAREELGIAALPSGRHETLHPMTLSPETAIPLSAEIRVDSSTAVERTPEYLRLGGHAHLLRLGEEELLRERRRLGELEAIRLSGRQEDRTGLADSIAERRANAAPNAESIANRGGESLPNGIPHTESHEHHRRSASGSELSLSEGNRLSVTQPLEATSDTSAIMMSARESAEILLSTGELNGVERSRSSERRRTARGASDRTRRSDGITAPAGRQLSTREAVLTRISENFASARQSSAEGTALSLTTLPDRFRDELRLGVEPERDPGEAAATYGERVVPGDPLTARHRSSGRGTAREAKQSTIRDPERIRTGETNRSEPIARSETPTSLEATGQFGRGRVDRTRPAPRRDAAAAESPARSLEAERTPDVVRRRVRDAMGAPLRNAESAAPITRPVDGLEIRRQSVNPTSNPADSEPIDPLVREAAPALEQRARTAVSTRSTDPQGGSPREEARREEPRREEFALPDSRSASSDRPDRVGSRRPTRPESSGSRTEVPRVRTLVSGDREPVGPTAAVERRTSKEAARGTSPTEERVPRERIRVDGVIVPEETRTEHPETPPNWEDLEKLGRVPRQRPGTTSNDPRIDADSRKSPGSLRRRSREEPSGVREPSRSESGGAARGETPPARSRSAITIGAKGERNPSKARIDVPRRQVVIRKGSDGIPRAARQSEPLGQSRHSRIKPSPVRTMLSPRAADRRPARLAHRARRDRARKRLYGEFFRLLFLELSQRKLELTALLTAEGRAAGNPSARGGRWEYIERMLGTLGAPPAVRSGARRRLAASTRADDVLAWVIQELERSSNRHAVE